MKKVNLQLRDWYFFDCPADELAACCYYEYARYSSAVVEAVRSLDGATKQFMESFPTASYSAVLFEKIPGTPWLDLPPTKRRDWVDRWQPPAAGLNLVVTSPANIVYQPPAFPGQGPCLLHSPEETIAAIKVPWGYDDDQLKAAFKRFLKTHRPPLRKLPSDAKAAIRIISAPWGHSDCCSIARPIRRGPHRAQR